MTIEERLTHIAFLVAEIVRANDAGDPEPAGNREKALEHLRAVWHEAYQDAAHQLDTLDLTKYQFDLGIEIKLRNDGIKQAAEHIRAIDSARSEIENRPRDIGGYERNGKV